MKAYYFGALRGFGHRLWRTDGIGATTKEVASLPQRLRAPDGTLCPDLPGQPQSLCRVTHVDGWTIVACWDRTADSRPNSNSAFVLEGEMLFAAAMLHAAAFFPEVMRRIGSAAPLVEAAP